MELVKPNFMIVGAAKSATTSIASYIANSDDVFISEIKEPRYFIGDLIKDICDEDPIKHNILIKESIFKECEYYSLFSKTKKKYKGEASVHYLYHHDTVIPRIRKELGDIPIIIILRNPVDRALSNIKYLHNHHGNTPDFELTRENNLIRKNYNSFWYYKQSGFYYNQVKAYIDHFTNVKVLKTEDLLQSPLKITNDVLEFLRAKKIKNLDVKILNNSLQKSTLSLFLKKLGVLYLIKLFFVESFVKKLKTKFHFLLKSNSKLEFSIETRQKLINDYKDDIIKLENLLNRKLWKLN